MLRHIIRMANVDLMTPDKDKTKRRLEVIRKDKEKILTHVWTPLSTDNMLILNEEQILLENPGIDPDMANSRAHYEEANNLKKGVYVIPSHRKSDQLDLSKRLEAKAKDLEKKALQKLQKNQ